VVAALFRDAKLADLIEQSPCILDERQLGPLVDKDPEWRNEAVLARDEVETIISDARIPADRQMVYALELLAGVRPGEAAAQRWRHYDPTAVQDAAARQRDRQSGASSRNAKAQRADSTA
jgi:integrase